MSFSISSLSIFQLKYVAYDKRMVMIEGGSSRMKTIPIHKILATPSSQPTIWLEGMSKYVTVQEKESFSAV